MRRAILAAAVPVVFAFFGSAAHAVTPLRVSTSVSPRPAFFGQRVTARAEVVIPGDADARGVDLRGDFTPYAVVGEPRRSVTSEDGVTTVGFVFELECLNDGCLPRRTMRSVQLPDAHAGSTRVHWPPVVVAPRVSAAQARADVPPWRVQLALPQVSYRARPAVLAALATLGAAVLALAAAAIVAFELLRRRRLRLERERALSRLARAVALLRESEGRAPSDRRKALALLARELDGTNGLASEASALAWGRGEPSSERIETLAREVERMLVP